MNNIPKEHIDKLNNKDFKDEFKDEKTKNKYVRILFSLAAKKVNLRNSDELYKEYYQSEIENCRTHLKKLLNR